MSAFHHRRYVEEFRQHGGTLTAAQLAVVAGWGDWCRDIREMRRLGYLIVEDPTDLFHLDLEELPELDAGRDGDGALLSGARSEGGSPDAVAVSPDVESVPLFETEPTSASPYDPSVEAA